MDKGQKSKTDGSSKNLEIIGKSQAIIDFKKDVLLKPTGGIIQPNSSSNVEPYKINSVRVRPDKHDKEVDVGSSEMSNDQHNVTILSESQELQNTHIYSINKAKFNQQLQKSASQQEYADQQFPSKQPSQIQNKTQQIAIPIRDFENKDIQIMDSSQIDGVNMQSIENYNENHSAFNLPGSNYNSSLKLKNENSEGSPMAAGQINLAHSQTIHMADGADSMRHSKTQINMNPNQIYQKKLTEHEAKNAKSDYNQHEQSEVSQDQITLKQVRQENYITHEQQSSKYDNVKSNPRTDKTSHGKMISKRSSVDKLQVLQSDQILRDQQKNNHMNKKSLMLNNRVTNAYKSNEHNSLSTNSLVSGDNIASTFGMIGAQSKLSIQNQQSGSLPKLAKVQNDGPNDLLKISNDNSRQVQISSRHQSNLNRPPIGGISQNTKDMLSKKSVLYGTKLKGKQKQMYETRKTERDEILDEVFKIGNETELRQSQSSSVIQDPLVGNDNTNDMIRVTKGGIIVNEYGQNAASHHFLLNLDGNKKVIQKTSGASPINVNPRNRSHKSMGLRTGQSKQNPRKQKVTRDARTIKFFTEVEKFKEQFKSKVDASNTQIYSVKRGMESPSNAVDPSHDLDMMSSFQDHAKFKNNLHQPVSHFNAQENIFMSNMQNNILKRPTSMPNFNDNNQKNRKKSMYGPTIKETFKNSDQYLEASDITTSAGHFAEINRKRMSNNSKQFPMHPDQLNLQHQLDQQRLKIEYLTKLNEELLKERQSQKMNGMEQSLSSQNLDNLLQNPDNLEPYNQTPEDNFAAINDDFASINSKSNNIYGTVNINKLITSKKGEVSRNNTQGLNKLDRQGLKTQTGAFFRNSRKESKETDSLGMQVPDRTQQPSLNFIRQSIPVVSNMNLNNLTGPGAALPRLPLYNAKNNLNIKMPQNIKGSIMVESNSQQVNESNSTLNLKEKNIKSQGLLQSDIDSVDIQSKIKKISENKNMSLTAAVENKYQTQQSSRVQLEEDQSLRKDINLSETKTDNRKPNTTTLSEEDPKNQGDDQLDNIELGLMVKSTKPGENIQMQVQDEVSKLNETDMSLQSQEPPKEQEKNNMKSEKFLKDLIEATPKLNKKSLVDVSPIRAHSQEQSKFVSQALANVRVTVKNGNDNENVNKAAGSIYAVKNKSKLQVSQMHHVQKGIAQGIEPQLTQESKLLESTTTYNNTSQMQGVMASNLTNQTHRVCKEQTQLTRLNNDLRKFKVKLEEQEQDNVMKETPIDGVQNLHDLINKTLIPKLGKQNQLPTVLKMVMQQIRDNMVSQQAKNDKQENLLRNQIEFERKNQNEYKTLATKLQQQIEYEKHGLDRFLKGIGKENVLQMIKEYEKMGPLPIESLLISKGRLMTNENKVEVYNNPFEESTQYSGLSTDLQIQLQMMRARAGDFLSDEQMEMLSMLAPKNQINEVEVIEKVENALLLCFSSLQTTTAKQVLQRCIKKVINKDQATQMGVDMFEEERVAFRMQIEALNEQITSLTQTSNSLTEINKRLMSDKAEQSRQARHAKEQLEKVQLELTQSQTRYSSLLSQYERIQDKVKEKNSEIYDHVSQAKRLQSRIDELKIRVIQVQNDLEAKRFKKRQYKLQVEHLMEKLEEADEDQGQLMKKLKEQQYNMANGQVRRLRKVRRPLSGRGTLTFKEKRKMQNLASTNLMNTDLNTNQPTSKGLESKGPDASTSQTRSPNVTSAKREQKPSNEAQSQQDHIKVQDSQRQDQSKPQQYQQSTIQAQEKNAQALEQKAQAQDSQPPVQDEEIDEDQYTEESYYVPLEEAYEEIVQEKERQKQIQSGRHQAGSSQDYKKDGQFINILTDEQYIKMADSLGIFDVSQIGEDFTLTRNEALDRINQWFHNNDSIDDTEENSAVQKAKTAMANELWRRFSMRNQNKLLQKIKTIKNFDQESVKSAISMNIDLLSDAEIEVLYKKIKERRKRKGLHDSPKNQNQFNSLKTDSDMQQTDEEQKLKEIMARYVKNSTELQYDAYGKLIIGDQTGDPHFDINMRPILDPATGLPLIYDKKGLHINTSVLPKSKSQIQSSATKKTAMIKINKGVDVNDSDKLLDFTAMYSRPNYGSGYDQPDFLDQLDNYRLLQKQMKVQGQSVDVGVQVETDKLGYRLVNVTEQFVGQTQTYDHYFPFDEETRMRIANILGNKLHSSSDLAKHSHQSLSAMLIPNASYLMQSQAKDSSQGSTYIWPKNQNKCRTFEPLQLKHRLNQSTSPSYRKEKPFRNQAKTLQKNKKMTVAKPKPAEPFGDDLPVTSLQSPTQTRLKNIGLPMNPYGILSSDTDPTYGDMLGQSQRPKIENVRSPVTERDKSGQVSFKDSKRNSLDSSTINGNKTGRFANEPMMRPDMPGYDVNLKVNETQNGHMAQYKNHQIIPTAIQKTEEEKNSTLRDTLDEV